jgi:hypothetical protein
VLQPVEQELQSPPPLAATSDIFLLTFLLLQVGQET